MLIIRKAQVARPDPVVKHIRMWIQILINYSENQKMNDKDNDCRGVFQFKKSSVKNGLKYYGTEALNKEQLR